jgi:hypothetical protein
MSAFTTLNDQQLYLLQRTTLNNNFTLAATMGILVWNSALEYGVNAITLGSDGVYYTNIFGASGNINKDPANEGNPTYWKVTNSAHGMYKVGTAFIGGDRSGNARGTNALDIQSARSAVTEVASGTRSVAQGTNNTASGNYTTAIGYGNLASGDHSTTIGKSNQATTGFGVAVGTSNWANGNVSQAFGHNNQATNSKSTALGCDNTASGTYCLAVGCSNTASAIYSAAVGIFNTASGWYSVAMGYSNTASGYYGTAVGWTCSASAGYHNSSFGNTCQCSGSGGYNIAMGYNALLSGTSQKSASMGVSTVVTSSNYASSMGIGCAITAGANNSIAIGHYTKITGISSVFEAGMWASGGATRTAVIRSISTGSMAFSYRQSDATFTDGGATAGAEAATTLPRGMLACRVNNVGDTLVFDVNVGGTIKTGTVSIT